MQSRKKYLPVVIANALMLAILLLFRDTGIITFKIYGVTPMLPLAVLVAIGMFAGELPSFLTGLAVGIILDEVSAAPTGFNAICFMLIGLFTSLMANHIFNKNFSASVALCIICSLFYFLLRFAVCEMLSLTLYENMRYILRYVLPSSAYTSVFVIPFYFIEKRLFKAAL